MILVSEAETAKDAMDKAVNIDMLLAEIINGFNAQVVAEREVVQGVAEMDNRPVIIATGAETAAVVMGAESVSIAWEVVNHRIAGIWYNTGE